MIYCIVEKKYHSLLAQEREIFMGLIKAALGAAGGALGSTWKEFFYCDAIPQDVLAVKGEKRTGKRSSNRDSDNIITNGSGIAVADGQCMIIVDQGKVVEVCAEPGEYTYDTSSEPSIFCGSFGKGLADTFEQIGKRFTYGGDTGKDQRVYYFNMKELMDNKFGTPNPIPFRVVDGNIGLDIDVSVRCSGVYSYRIADPLLFYTNVCGNVRQAYRRSEIETQMKTEFISALQPAFAKISALGIRPSALPAHAEELAGAMNEVLTNKWLQTRGIAVVSIALNPITLPEEDAEMIKQAQRMAINRNPGMAAATLVGAQADAMKAAAANRGGAMTGFMGMGMAAQSGGMNAQELFAMDAKQKAAQTAEQGQNPAQAAAPIQGTVGAKKTTGTAASGSWRCSCGTENTGKFCMECGKSRPQEGWTCSCGTLNKGKFCTECGKPKPEGALLYRCDKCGWEPEDPKNPPRFCPECGDPFTDADVVR